MHEIHRLSTTLNAVLYQLSGWFRTTEALEQAITRAPSITLLSESQSQVTHTVRLNGCLNPTLYIKLNSLVFALNHNLSCHVVAEETRGVGETSASPAAVLSEDAVPASERRILATFLYIDPPDRSAYVFHGDRVAEDKIEYQQLLTDAYRSIIEFQSSVFVSLAQTKKDALGTVVTPEKRSVYLTERNKQ